MAKATQVKTRSKAGSTEILCRINHPMETGWRVDKDTKQRIPPHFIQKIVFEVNGKQVAVADVGMGMSRDPLFIIRVKGAKPGDSVEVKWTDNKGERGNASTTVA
jgi:sulfur-oxidizing protein SoxZ